VDLVLHGYAWGGVQGVLGVKSCWRGRRSGRSDVGGMAGRKLGLLVLLLLLSLLLLGKLLG